MEKGLLSSCCFDMTRQSNRGDGRPNEKKRKEINKCIFAHFHVNGSCPSSKVGKYFSDTILLQISQMRNEFL